MSLALPGSRGLFSQMQEALRHVNGKRFTLTWGVHEALSDFQWLAEDMASRPTCLFNLVPLTPTLDGYHDSSGDSIPATSSFRSLLGHLGRDPRDPKTHQR